MWTSNDQAITDEQNVCWCGCPEKVHFEREEDRLAECVTCHNLEKMGIKMKTGIKRQPYHNYERRD